MSSDRVSVAVPLRNAAKGGSWPQARVLLDDEHELDESEPRDVPLGVKRKRNERPKKNEPRVIPMSKEHDWREDRKKRLGLLDKHAFKPGSLGSMRRGDTAVTAASTPLPLSRKAEAASKEPERAFTEPQKRGLVVRQRESSTPPPTVIVPGDVTPPMDEDTPPPAETNSTEANEATDEDALRALLTGEETSKTNLAKLIIQQPSEEDMFRHDVDTRPEAPTLEAYSSMPIEEFGAAMLRGMGWKDGSGIGKKRSGPTTAPLVQRRAALLGLGAKEHNIPIKDSRTYIPAVRREISRDLLHKERNNPSSSYDYKRTSRSYDRDHRDHDHDRSSREGRYRQEHDLRENRLNYRKRCADDRYRDRYRDEWHHSRHRDERHREDRHWGERHRISRSRDDRHDR